MSHSEEVHRYRRELRTILEALGRPDAAVTGDTRLRDFPLAGEPAPTLVEVEIATGLRVEPQHRLLDIARRMRQLAERQIAAATLAVRHAWVEWLGERDAAALLLTLMQAIDKGGPVERLQAMVDDWRRNALEALAADDYRADVDKYLEVSADARLYLLAQPALRRRMEDLADEDGAASPES